MKGIRLLSIFLAAVLVFTLLVGCAEKGNSSTTTATTTTAVSSASASTPEEPKQPTGKVIFWTAWAADRGPGKWIEQFNEKYPDITVEHINFPNDKEGNIKLDVALLAGQEVDVCFNYGVERFAPRASKGLYEDLTPYLEKDKIDIPSEFSINTYKYQDKYYGLPNGAISDVVIINLDLLKEKNIPMPSPDWTYDDYLDISRRLTVPGNPRIYGTCDFMNKDYWTMGARGVLGSNAWYNKDGLSNFDHPTYKQALDLRYKMEIEEEIMFPNLEIWANKASTTDLFLQGRIAMYMSSSSAVRSLADLENFPRDFKVAFFPYPKLTKDQPENYMRGLRLFDYLSMSAKSANKDAAWEFMKWLSTEGSVGLAQVGHMPTWKKSDKDAVIKTIIKPEAIETFDIDSIKKYLVDYESPCYADSEFIAYAQIMTLIQEAQDKVLTKTLTVDDALEELKKKADEVILQEKEK